MDLETAIETTYNILKERLPKTAKAYVVDRYLGLPVNFADKTTGALIDFTQYMPTDIEEAQLKLQNIANTLQEIEKWYRC